ncbi:hypothetical protein [Duganella sp. P38]|uniref:hypothetical protein n=1 Tax=Duganella sp. P38 TaxID=3423949 RepID=UPI003D7A57E8
MPRALPKTASAIQFLLIAAMPAAALADNFTIDGNSGNAQTLASGQTGTVSAAGALTVSGSTVAVTVAGSNVTLNNLGAIKQTGTGRVIRDNSGAQALVINNGAAGNSSALMQSADADVIQMNVKGASVTLNNYGVMISSNASAGGAQVVDFNAITTGANVVNNYAGAQIIAYEADAVRTGVNGVVNNSGMIRSVAATGGGSDGIDAQNASGAKISNLGGGVIEGAGTASLAARKRLARCSRSTFPTALAVSSVA